MTSQVRKRRTFLRCHLMLKIPSFYQDRLGTNIAKAEIKGRSRAGSCSCDGHLQEPLEGADVGE
eukprot:COSAG06_NODE_13280_length_1259_cov_1.508936_1_plen_64_part_00